MTENRNWLERQIDTTLDDGIVILAADAIEETVDTVAAVPRFLDALLTDAATSMVPHSWRGR